MPEPPHNPDDALQVFLAQHPEYRPYVVWDEERQGYAMPGWLGNRFYSWQLARVRPTERN